MDTPYDSIAAAIDLYDADKLGLVDHASWANGARVIYHPRYVKMNH